MCFYIQSSAFQERTEAAVSSLQAAVETASSALERAEASAGRVDSTLGKMGSALSDFREENALLFQKTAGELHGLAALAGTSVDAMGACICPLSSGQFSWWPRRERHTCGLHPQTDPALASS